MQFLGTAAADILPGPLCGCPICEDARQNPAHRRLRSMFLLDERNLIDCGPDLAAAAMRLGLNLTKLQRVFVTHTHEDHFCPSNAAMVPMSRTRPDVPLDVYLSEAGYEMTLQLRERLGDTFAYFDAVKALDNGLVRLHPVKIKAPFELDGYRIMAVESSHRVSEREAGVNYLFEKLGGVKLLYASDTGLYEQDTLEALRGSRADVLIMEATWGSRTDKNPHSHLSAVTYLQMLDMLRAADVIRKDTRCFATHINHKHAFTHDMLQAWFDANADMHVTVAYDGLTIQ